MTIQQIDLVFRRCDLDKDGKLSFDEFERWGSQNSLTNAFSFGSNSVQIFQGWKSFLKCRMMKRHMVGSGGLTIEESERMVEEAETDEEIEEQVDCKL